MGLKHLAARHFSQRHFRALGGGGRQGQPSTLPPRMRVVYQNCADTAAALVANTDDSAFPVLNVLNDIKSKIHRTPITLATYRLTWGSAQRVGAVALPATNLSAAATIRVQLFSDMSASTQLADSGVVSACASPYLGVFGEGGPRDSRSFSFSGASKSAVWFPEQIDNVRACVITISDPSNPAGFIDCARLVVGPYWEATKSPDYGAQAGVADLTRASRLVGGDLVAARGGHYQTMSLNLTELPERARAELHKILRSATAHRNLFISLFPDYPVEGTDHTIEQDHMVYGRRSPAPFTLDHWGSFSTRFDIEGW